MTQVSDVSARTRSYASACERLRLDPKEPRVSVEDGEGVLLNPWQVMGVAWAVEQEDGPIRGGLIADACGIGKTIQMLSVIALTLEWTKHDVKTHPELKIAYRPTLVLCPSAVVEVWFSEIRKHFPQLKAYRWFEHAEKQNLAHIRDATLPTKAEELKHWMKEKLPQDNINSIAAVIISSYDTACLRGLVVTPSKNKQGTCSDFSLSTPSLFSSALD
jgi:SNF2 family DNA or RNA helicase